MITPYQILRLPDSYVDCTQRRTPANCTKIWRFSSAFRPHQHDKKAIQQILLPANTSRMPGSAELPDKLRKPKLTDANEAIITADRSFRTATLSGMPSVAKAASGIYQPVVSRRATTVPAITPGSPQRRTHQRESVKLSALSNTCNSDAP